jgi:8-oxo-dGTP pyrophosphatase MutT (NUDIX family)
VINYRQQFVIQKRSKNKDYCPGYLDLAAGGVVGAHEEEDDNAIRELQEELNIEEPDPSFVFKFPYEDDNVRAWNYVYYYL